MDGSSILPSSTLDHLELLIDLHRDGPRQGPGGDAETRRAIELAGLADEGPIRILDVGCGTGASTLVLARELDARIAAVDALAEFLGILNANAARDGVADRIATMECSMDRLPFDEETVDAIWSEGAIYNLGFERGITEWRPMLRRGGVLAVTEITWLTAERPPEIEAHWLGQYPEIATASVKIAQLERAGYTPIGYFPLPPHCWLDNYYRPMQARFDEFLERHDHSELATAIVDAERHEIDLYERYSTDVGYGFYVARRHDG